MIQKSSLVILKVSWVCRQLARLQISFILFLSPESSHTVYKRNCWWRGNNDINNVSFVVTACQKMSHNPHIVKYITVIQIQQLFIKHNISFRPGRCYCNELDVNHIIMNVQGLSRFFLTVPLELRMLKKLHE